MLLFGRLMLQTSLKQERCCLLPSVEDLQCNEGAVPQVDLSAVCDAGPPLSSMVQRGQDLARRLQLLQVDRREMACLKFLILFNPSESDPDPLHMPLRCCCCC